MSVINYSSHVDLFLAELALRNIDVAQPEVQMVVESMRSGSLGSQFFAASAENAHVSK